MPAEAERSHQINTLRDLEKLPLDDVRSRIRANAYSGHTAGLAAGYQQCNVVFLPAADALDIQTYQLALYGSYNLDARNYIDAHAIVGWNDNESRRDVTIGTFTSTASADYDSFFTRIYAGLGRKYAVNDQFTVSPVISIRYTYIDEDGYTETGAPIALAVGSNDEDSLILGLDGVGRYTFGAGNAYSITARAGVGYDAITDRTLVSCTFVGGGSTFATRGAEPDEFVYHASFGLHSDPGAQTSVSIEYDFEGRQDFDVHGFSATVRWRF